jgi:hypothetical protein
MLFLDGFREQVRLRRCRRLRGEKLEVYKEMGLRLFEVVERKEGGETRLELRGGNTRITRIPRSI